MAALAFAAVCDRKENSFRARYRIAAARRTAAIPARMYKNPARRPQGQQPCMKTPHDGPCGRRAGSPLMVSKRTISDERSRSTNRFAEFGFENTYGHGLHRDLPFGIGQCAERTAEALLRQSVAQAVVSERQGPSHAEISFIGVSRIARSTTRPSPTRQATVRPSDVANSAVR